jgi:hypothetical protein
VLLYSTSASSSKRYGSGETSGMVHAVVAHIDNRWEIHFRGINPINQSVAGMLQSVFFVVF